MRYTGHIAWLEGPGLADDFLSAAARTLERAARGASEGDIDAELAPIAALTAANGGAAEFGAFRQSVVEIARTLRDNATAEKGLTLLIDTTHDLSSRLNLSDLFATIVTRARNLVGANLAWVTVLDDESGMFRTVTAEGYLSESLAGMRAHTEYGAVSLIMKSKSYFATQDYLGDKRFRHMPELDRIFQTENIISLAGFPMLADGEVHGFLFIADRYSRKLSGREMSILGSFALHAAVATRNANAFGQLSEALDEAERTRRALIDHIQRVDASAAAHDEMTSLLASGAQLQQFLQGMASQIAGAIFLFDENFKISEEFIAGAYQGQCAHEFRAGRFDPALLITATSQSKHTGRSVVALTRDDEQCRTIALHGGTGSGESLVVCYQGELDAIDVRNFERNAVALSIAKLWNEKRETDKAIASSTLLRHLVLVTPPDATTISAIRDRLGLGTDHPVMLALIVLSGADRAAQTAHLRSLASGTDVLVDLFEDTYLAFGPTEPLRAFLQQLKRSRDGAQAAAILSDPFADLTAASAQFARMSRALQVLRKMKRLQGFVEQSDVNLFAKIFETGDAARVARYVDETLEAIRAKAPRQAAQLKQTLLCYFDSQYNAKRVADALGLHINTVRQRLDTLRGITGGWDDPVKALELHVALRLDAIGSIS
jgi:hypothetical protein